MPLRRNGARDNQVKEPFQYFLKILKDPLVTKKLMKMINLYVDTEEESISSPLPKRGV